MQSYKILLSKNAERDLQDYIDFIIVECSAPMTALRHYENFFNTLKTLETFPESFPVQKSKSFFKFGANPRRLNFKNMAIIYTVHKDVVFIHRIIASTLIWL